MMEFARKCLNLIRLAVLWVRRILLAPNHFGVSVFQRIKLSIMGGYVVDQYAIYDFKHNDRKQYLSEFDWYRSRHINHPFDAMLNNKIVCTEVLRHHVDVPELLLMKNHGKIVSLEQGKANGYRDYSDVIELARRYGILFVKPLAAGKGKGVKRIEFDGSSMLVDGSSTSEDAIMGSLKKEKAWFISLGVKQHPYLDEIYDKTTNTIRLITFRDSKSGCYKVFFAVQRIGTSDTIPVDNGSRGGLVSKINLDTGVMSEAKCLQSLCAHRVHPDSHAPIEGVRIPDWEIIKSTMLRLAETFPFIPFIAWDILPTATGLSVIEANTSSGVNIIQLWGPQRYGELGDFYRAHSVRV